ncbi:hypothetical protein CRUP_017308, partial [Coryphaenoides rupestris]
RSAVIQDVQLGSRGCERGSLDDQPLPRQRAVTTGDDVLLQCELISNLATPLWTRDGAELGGEGPEAGLRTGTDGLLIVEVRPAQRGVYTCHGVENGVRVAMVTYNVSVRPETPPQRPPPPRPPLRSLPPADRGPGEEPPADTRGGGVTGAPEAAGAGRPLPRSPLLPRSELLSPPGTEAWLYLSLITVLGGLCVVLSVVLLYVGCCLRAGSRGRYSLRAAAAGYGYGRKKSGRRPQRSSASSSSCSQLELRTVSGRCNGNGAARKQREAMDADAGLLQIVPGEGQPHANGTRGNGGRPPPPPPLPSSSPSQQQQQQQQQQQPPSPESEFPAALSATLPSVLRRLNGNSYVLLRQSDARDAVANGYAFNDELSRMLEKRKHTQQLQPRPDESSV